MNNNQPQQNYQPQQGYQQPGYQQGYQPSYQPKPKADIVSIIAKITSVLSLVFLIIAGVAFLYCFIMTIVCAASDKAQMAHDFYIYTSKGEKSGFATFLDGFAWTISTTAKYLFYSGVLALIGKVSKK